MASFEAEEAAMESGNPVKSWAELPIKTGDNGLKFLSNGFKTLQKMRFVHRS